jgi:predicted nucleic acid-binding protein
VLCSVRDAVLLTDDLDARTTATEEGIEVHGVRRRGPVRLQSRRTRG